MSRAKSINELEALQKAFNELIEAVREFVSGLQQAAGQNHQKTQASINQYFNQHKEPLVKSASHLLSLMNIKRSDEALDIDLFRTMETALAQGVGQGDGVESKFDEKCFILIFTGRIKSSWQQLSYTGTKDSACQTVFGFSGAFPEKLHGIHSNNLRLTHPEYADLLNKIDLLRLHGSYRKNEKLAHASNERSCSLSLAFLGIQFDTQDHAIDIADELYQSVSKYLSALDAPSGDISSDLCKQQIKQILLKGKKQLGNDRNAFDILAHIALACTIIGIPVMLYQWHETGSVFLNRTKRQVIFDQAKDEANKIPSLITR